MDTTIESLVTLLFGRDLSFSYRGGGWRAVGKP
jgi:hypothetical protein